jgi:hypothetical protein
MPCVESILIGTESWLNFDGSNDAAWRTAGGVYDWRPRPSAASSANDWFCRAGDSIAECGDVKMESLGDGVRGGARAGETEAGGFDELAGDRDGGEATELRKE